MRLYLFYKREELSIYWGLDLPPPRRRKMFFNPFLFLPGVLGLATALELSSVGGMALRPLILVVGCVFSEFGVVGFCLLPEGNVFGIIPTPDAFGANKAEPPL
mmetsp:Transcript_31306/g.72057  ORF Transcript_31306/g.72057 Transcript_31306/m.72057 type:complete len:103 (+) Transcript_31306:124-432(+)